MIGSCLNSLHCRRCKSVDGVTITYCSNLYKHIWTYAGSLSKRLEDQVLYWCPCNIGSNGTTVSIVL